MHTASTGEMLSPQQLADYLNVSVETVYHWRHRGEGPRGYRVGRQVRYRLSEVDDWLESHASDVRDIGG